MPHEHLIPVRPDVFVRPSSIFKAEWLTKVTEYASGDSLTEWWLRLHGTAGEVYFVERAFREHWVHALGIPDHR